MIDKKELAKGKKHELEHGKDPKLALKIALDHLRKYPRYYTYLAQMEKEMEKK